MIARGRISHCSAEALAIGTQDGILNLFPAAALQGQNSSVLSAIRYIAVFKANWGHQAMAGTEASLSLRGNARSEPAGIGLS